MIKRQCLVVLVLLCASFMGFGQILTFEFSALAGNEVSAGSNFNNANLTTSTITRGAGLTALANGGRFNATNWALTSINNAVGGDKYMEFTITPNPTYQFSVSSIIINLQRSATGPSELALRSSVDSYSSDLDVVKSIVDNTSTQIFTFTFIQANSTSAVTYRFYMYAEATTGSGGIGDGTGDDIIVNGSVTSTTPTISVTPSSLTNFTYAEGGGPSAEQNFTLSGSYLTNDISIAPPTNWEISTGTGGSFSATNPITLTQTGGNVASTTIYTRLKSGLLNSNSPFSGNIAATSTGATTKNVAVNGTVIPPLANVVITEIMYNTPTPGNDYEWIEICNEYGIDQSLSNYVIKVNGTIRYTFPASFTITDGSCITILLGNDGTSTPFCPHTPLGAPVVTNILTNTTRTIEIIASNGVTVADAVTYNNTDGADGNGSSLHVIDINQDNSNTNNTNWQEVPDGGSPGINSLMSPCSKPELQLKNSSGTNQVCGAFTINFGSQATSFNTDLTFDIYNEGTLDLTITSLVLSGVNSGDFIIVSPATPFTITKGNTQTVAVRFTPTAIGIRVATLTINNNDVDEGTCAIAFQGTGTTPAPEIDVERNTFASIASGSAANTGNNTVFASAPIGSSTTPKTYYIRNEGTANLTISSISSSNATEFPVSTNPAPLTLLPGEFIAFEILFSPSGTGTRNSTISIINNDTTGGENPYTFGVAGNGQCAASSISLSPLNGPEGTVVTVSGGTNFIGSTTVSFNGVSASTINVISNAVLEVVVPVGATTGSLVVNDNSNCLSSKLFTIIDQAISSCGGSGTLPSDLFISEVTDKGTGSHTYIEIFNGTGGTIDLSTYQVRIHNNGATSATSTIPLSGNILNYSVVVIGLGGTNATDPEGGYTAQFFSGAGGINEDDHIRLYNGATWVDLWGDTSGNPFTIASKDYTYRRINTGITVPSTTWNLNDWEAFTPVDYSDIGLYDFSTGTPPSVASGPTLNSSCNTATIGVTGTEGSDPAGLAYQWYYSAPGDAGWVEATNGAIYNDVTLATLDILDTSLLEGYQYYCQIREDDASCYSASNAVQVTLPTTTWDGSSWTPASGPDINTIIIIDGDYDTGITGSFEACNLIINAGKQLNVADNTFVKVQNNVIVHGSTLDGPEIVELRVQTKGAFVQVDDAGTFTVNPGGTARVIKETALIKKWYEYTYWSSPVENQTVQDAFPDTPSTRRFWYKAQNYLDSTREVGNNNQTVSGQDDIDDNGDDWQIATGSSIMTKGLGYAATSSQLGMFPRYDQATFEGAFHTGDVFVDIYRNDTESADNNWNLLGNPYPSAINADLFLATNSVIDNSVDEHTPGGVTDGAIFFWSQDSSPSKNNNGNENENFAQSDYAIINTFTQTKGGDNVTPNRFIPSGQGFFVSYSNSGSGTLLPGNIYKGTIKFTNAMRMADGTSNSQFFRTSGSASAKKLPNKFWVNLTSDNGVFNQIAFGYVDNATNNDDGMAYDTPRNLSSELFSSIYTLIPGMDKKFAIQGKVPNSLNLDEVIALGFDTTIDVATLYTLSVENVEGDFLSSNPVYLKDNLMHIVHNLTASDYNFTSEVGEFKDRFEIMFRSETLSDTEAQLNSNNLTIIELNDGRVQIKTNSNLNIKSVKVIDVLGRTLYQLKGSSATEIYNLSNLSQSAYIAKVELSNGQIITKRAIKRN